LTADSNIWIIFFVVTVLKQLAELCAKAAVVPKRKASVDDIPTGCDKIEALIALKEELILLLSKAQFKLKKWCLNKVIAKGDV